MDFEKMLKEEMKAYQTKYNQVEMNYFYRLEGVKEKCALKITVLESRVEELFQDFTLNLNRAEMALNEAQTKEYETYIKNEEELAKAFEQEKINDLPQAMKKIERLYMAKKVMETKIENGMKDINLLQNKLIALREQNEYMRTELNQTEAQNKLLKSCLNYFLDLSKLPDMQIEKVKKWFEKEKYAKIVEKFASGDLFSAKTLENITLRVQVVREKVSELAMHTVDKDASTKLYQVLNDLNVEDIVQNSEMQIILLLPEEIKKRFSAPSSAAVTPRNSEPSPKKSVVRKPKSKAPAVTAPSRLAVEAPSTDRSGRSSRRSVNPPKDTHLDSRPFQQKRSVDEPRRKKLPPEIKLTTPSTNILPKSPSGLSELLAPKGNLKNLVDDIDIEIENRLKEIREAQDHGATKEIFIQQLPTVTSPKELLKQSMSVITNIPDIPAYTPDVQFKPTKKNTPKQAKSKTASAISISKTHENTQLNFNPETELKPEPQPITTLQSISSDTESDRLTQVQDLYNLHSEKDQDEMEVSFIGKSEGIQVELHNEYQHSSSSRLDSLAEKRTLSRQTLNYKLSGSQISDKSYSDIYQIKTFEKTYESSRGNMQVSLRNLKDAMSYIISQSSRPSSKHESTEKRAVTVNHSISKVMNSEIAVGEASYKFSFVVNWFIENYFKEYADTESQTDKSYELNNEPRIHNYMNAIRGILLKNMKDKSDSSAVKTNKTKESSRNNVSSLSGAKIDHYFNPKDQIFEGDYKFHSKSESADGMTTWLQNAALRTAVAYEEYKAEFMIEARRLGLKKIEVKDAAKIWELVIRRRLREGEGDDISVYLRGFQGTHRFDTEVEEIVQLLQHYKKNELIQKIQKLPGKIQTTREEQQEIQKQRKPLVISRWRDLMIRIFSNHARKIGRLMSLNSNLLDVWFDMAKNVRYVADRISKINERGFPHVMHHFVKRTSGSYQGWSVSNSPNILQKNKNVKKYYKRRSTHVSLSVTPTPEEITSRSKSGVRTSTAHQLRASVNSEERRSYKKAPDFMISARLPEIQKEKS